MASVVPSLAHLSSHSIFIPPVEAKPSPESCLDIDTDLDVPFKTNKMVIRDKDLIVAHGSEIRMTTIGGHDEWEVNDGKLGHFKTLVGKDLGFSVQSLAVNDDGRLLAVIGKTQITVVVLPRNGIVGLTSGPLTVKSFAIDRYQYAPTSSTCITKVRWHPWSQQSSSLWILSSDGKLREYDVLSPDDPAQTFSFLAPAPTSGSRFSAIDPLSRYATSFSFSPFTTSDFGPSVISVLCANGDVHYMGPIIPLHASVPVEWIQALRLIVERENPGSAVEEWVEGLVKQVREEETRKRLEDDDQVEGTPSRRYGGAANGASETAKEAEEPESGRVKLHPPHLTSSGGPATGKHAPLAKQGPILYDPAPEEISADIEEDIASDITFFQGSDDGETIMAVAWAGGRVDLGIVVDPLMPKWQDPKAKTSSETTLPIIESVLLPLSPNEPEAIAANAPVISLDPLNKGQIYVQHSFGVDSISVKPWISALDNDDGKDLLPSAIVRLVDSVGTPSKPIIGSFAFCNISFGYAFVALASSYQLATVELEFKVAKAVSEGPTVKEETKQEVKENPSLIASKPLDYASLSQSTKPAHPDLKALSRSISISPINTISRDMLKHIAEIVSHIQTRIQAVKKASQMIENHLDLCYKEYTRQIRVITQTRDTLSGLRDAKAQARVTQMVEKQQRLGERLDDVVRSLTGRYKPELGESEKRWFDELDRIGNRLGGSHGNAGLKSRVRDVQEQLKSLKPAISYRTRYESETNDAIDEKEVMPLGEALQERSNEIRRLLRKMDALSVRIDVAAEERGA